MTAKLEHQLAKLKQGDHLCSFYETRGEQLVVAVSFIVDGLARGDRCICIVDDLTNQEIFQALAAAGLDVALARRRDALRVLIWKDTCLRAGEFVPEVMIDVIRQAEAEALADGFSGVRQMGEMTWALGPERGCHRWIEFEAMVNHLLANSKIVSLCQYNCSRFDAHFIHDVFRTHPLVILSDQVCHNPYYESPEMVLSEDQAVTTPEFKAKRVQWWIAQLKRAQAGEQDRANALVKLKESERRLAEAQRVAHIGSWERDLRTDEANWSDELYRLFGLSPDEGNISYQRFLSFVSPQDGARIRAAADKAIRERSSFNIDYQITLHDSSVYMLNGRAAVVLNEHGEPIRLVGTAQDVTELRRAEEAQQETIRQKVILQTIFDNIPVMIAFVDPAGRFQLVSRHFEKVLGWSWEEVRDRDMFAEFYPDPQYRQLVLEYIRAAKPGWCDFKTRVRDGRTIDTAWANILLSDGTSIGIGQDVTERKRVEQALQENHSLLHAVVEGIPEALYIKDRQSRYLLANSTAGSMVGKKVEEVLGRDDSAWFDPTTARRFMEADRRVMESGVAETYEEVGTAAGITRAFLTFKAPYRGTDGAVLGVLGISRDISDRKQAEIALRQSEERLTLAVHAADLGIFEHDHQTDHLYWSPMMSAICGFAAQQAVSLPAFLESIHPEDRERIVAAIGQAHVGRNDGLYKAEHRLIRPNGGVCWVSVCARTLFEGEGDARRRLRTVGIVADITQRKRAEQENREYSQSVQALSRRLLEIQEQERQYLARELHDEFGQILCAVSLHLQAARRLAGEAAGPRLDECATMLQQAQEHVRSLALELRPAMLDSLGLDATLHWLARQHQQRIGGKVQVVGRLSETPLSSDMAIVCFRVVQEALTNIARHAAAQNVCIELIQSERVFELAVRDDGVGFDLVPTQEQAVRRGSVGMRGMRERVEILSGTLQVESEPGRGTRIHATFPLSEAGARPPESSTRPH